MAGRTCNFSLFLSDPDELNTPATTVIFQIIVNPVVSGPAVNICSRTQEVQDAILAVSADSACTSVTDLAAITTLDLRGDGITTLASGDFAGLAGLRDLLFNDNGLTTLPADIFAGLSALEQLNLFNNNLDTLPLSVFAGLTSVDELFINSNNFASLPVGIFDGLDALANLALADNPFTAGTGLPAGIFDDVIDTLVTTATGGGVGLAVDAVGRAAHFVCSLPQASLIEAANSDTSCLRITTAQLNTFVMTDTRLSALSISSGDMLMPDFAPGVTAYTVSVLNGVDSITVTPAASQPTATITVGGNNVDSGSPSAAIALTVGTPAAIVIVVTAPDGTTTGTVTLTATRLAATPPAATLAGSVTEANLFATTAPTVTVTLTGTNYVAAGELMPDDFTVTDTLADGTVSITGVARTGNRIATLTLGYDRVDVPDAGGMLSVMVLAASHSDSGDLDAGNVAITASTGTNICDRTQEVQNAIIATSAANTDCTNITNLATITTLELDNVGITALASGDFDGLTELTELLLIRNNGLTTLPADIFAGLSTLEQLNLFGNNINTLPLNVFAGLTSVDELFINRNNFASLPVGIFDGLTALENLALATNPFTPGTGLPADIFDDVLDTLGPVSTDGGGVGLAVDDDGLAAHFVCSRDDADAIVAATPPPALPAMPHCLRITNAQLTAALPLITDATLSGLTISDGGILAPMFDPATTDYTVGVANSVTSVMVTPTAARSAATITVNTAAVTSGATSDDITLTAGTPMDILIVVTAADGTTMMTYTVTATRAAGIPTVSGVAFTSTGPYALGEAIEVTVTFSENVIVTDTPAIALTVGSTARTAAYTSGTGSANLVFAYTVAARETDANGVSINANALTTPDSSAIQNAADNDADLTHDAVAAETTHAVDTAAPTLTVATINGSSMVLTYNEALNPSSTPANVAYTIGVSGTGTAPTVTEITISNTRAILSLSAAITRGVTVTVSYTPGSTPLRDTAGNDAAGLTTSPVTNATAAAANTIYTDNVIPADLNVGDEFRVDFDINHPDAGGGGGVVLWGETTSDCGISLRINDVGVIIFTPLVAQAGRTCNFVVRFEDRADQLVDTLEFAVLINAQVPVASDGSSTVTEGDDAVTINLGVTGTAPECATSATIPGGLTLNAAACTITGDVADDAITDGSSAQVFVIAWTATNSAGSDTGTYTLTVNAQTSAPMATVSGVAFTSTGPYALGEAIEVTVTFSENVIVTDTPAIALTVGSTARTAAFTSGSGSANLVFAYTVAARETDANGVSINANALTTPDSSAIQNAANTDADLTHDAVAAETTHAVDTAAPTLTGATVNGNSMVLTYNEDMNPSSTPANAAYTIAVSGTDTAPTVTGTTISGASATLALSAAVTRGLTVTVSYAPGSAPLQDTAGNDAAALATRSVTNATTVPANTIYTDDVIPATLNVREAFRVDFEINHPDASAGSFGNLWAGTTNDCGLPLSIGSAGILAFTPQVAQAEMTCNFVVRFEDGVVNSVVDTLEFAVRINAAAPVAPVAPDGSRTVTEGDSIAINLGVTGTSPVTCAPTSPLPGGLTLNGAACTITGDVAVDAITNGTLSQVFVITWTAENRAGADSGTYTLTVNALISSPTEERTTQLNQQILPRVFLSVVDGGNQLIAERLRNGSAAMSDGGSGSMSLTGGDGLLSPGVLKQAGQWLAGDVDELPWRDWVGGLAVSTDGSRLGLSPGVSLYANGNYTRLSGDGGGLDWDGTLYGGHGGVDSWVNDDVLVGVSASYFKGEFDYTGVDVTDGEYNVQVGSFQPYFGWTLLEGVDFWASGSYGVGDVELNDVGGRRESDLWYGSVSVGMSGQVYVSDALIAGGHSEVRLRGDGSALWVAMDRDDAGFEDLQNRRVRIGLEASHTRSAMGYGNLRTGLEAGVRSDSGDGPSGKGLEVGGSVEWRDAMPGLTLSSRGRVLTLGIYDEWGVSGALRLTPGNDGHGLSFSLSPSYGQENSGIEQLWQTGALGGVTPGVTSSAAPSARMRMDSEVGYGLPSSFGMVRPYLAASLQQGGGQTQRMGARWELSPGMKLNLEAARRERATTNNEHRLQLQWEWSW